MNNSKSCKIFNTILFLSIFLSAKSYAAAPISQINNLKPNNAVNSALSLMQINKNINLFSDDSQLLTFDEKIIRYKFKNDKDTSAELLSDINNSRQVLLIKLSKINDNKLTVWTASKVYNFNISVQKNNNSELKTVLNIREIPEDDIDGYIIDKPPILPEKECGMANFELDNPPKIKK